MNTLSIFPDLLTFWLFAPFLLRTAAGLIFIYFGISKIWKEKEGGFSFFSKTGFNKGAVSFWIVSLSELTGGVLLLLGLFTQAIALILSLIILGVIYTKIRQPDLLGNSLEFFILLFVVLLSLLFLGAGFWSIDLPL